MWVSKLEFVKSYGEAKAVEEEESVRCDIESSTTILLSERLSGSAMVGDPAMESECVEVVETRSTGMSARVVAV